MQKAEYTPSAFAIVLMWSIWFFTVGDVAGLIYKSGLPDWIRFVLLIGSIPGLFFLIWKVFKVIVFLLITIDK